MQSDLSKLVILLSILLLIAFPFAGLAPLMLIVFFAVCGWAFRLLSTITGAVDSTELETGDSQ